MNPEHPVVDQRCRTLRRAARARRIRLHPLPARAAAGSARRRHRRLLDEKFRAATFSRQPASTPLTDRIDDVRDDVAALSRLIERLSQRRR